jgi:thiamine phosphate synthase YjbQ (UPF0047 family)
MENADPTARRDLKELFERLVPEDSDYFTHDAEGSDDMPLHIRMVLTRTSETVHFSIRTSPHTASAKDFHHHYRRMIVAAIL